MSKEIIRGLKQQVAYLKSELVKARMTAQSLKSQTDALSPVSMIAALNLVEAVFHISSSADMEPDDARQFRGMIKSTVPRLYSLIESAQRFGVMSHSEPWTEFEMMTLTEEDVAHYPEDVQRHILSGELWGNSRYQVAIRGKGTKVTHLSIKRLDKLPIMDWRELQRIKNELLGSECEAIQVFPADSRLVDTSNQYHLFVLPEGEKVPFGFDSRLVTYESTGGAVQRPLED